MGILPHAKSEWESAISEAAPLIERLAQIGYITRGALFVIIGVLALRAAFQAGGGMTDARGALEVIFRQPFGRIVLGVVTVGLMGHALWRFIQAFFDPMHEGKAKGTLRNVGQRIAYLVGGFIFVGLFLLAVEIVLGLGGVKAQNNARYWATIAFAYPLGKYLVMAIGLILVGAGVAQFYLALTARFMERCDMRKMSRAEIRLMNVTGRLGYGARGVVFPVIGVSLIKAVIDHNPGEVLGFGQALGSLLGWSYGNWMLGMTAFGLILYGFFCMALARYRKIDVP